MTAWLVTSRDPNEQLVDAAVSHSLLKTQETGAHMVYVLTNDLWSTNSRQQQNDALMYDGIGPLVIDVEGKGRITMERVKE